MAATAFTPATNTLETEKSAQLTRKKKDLRPSVEPSIPAMNFVRHWIRTERKGSRSDSPVYVLRFDSPPRRTEDDRYQDVHFALWKQRFEGKNAIAFSIVLALLLGAAACFAFGTNSKAKESAVRHQPLTDFDDSKTVVTAKKRESQPSGKGTVTVGARSTPVSEAGRHRGRNQKRQTEFAADETTSRPQGGSDGLSSLKQNTSATTVVQRGLC
ncbi:uncharacterized protein LOC144120198 [Amblyomma americanum]